MEREELINQINKMVDNVDDLLRLLDYSLLEEIFNELDVATDATKIENKTVYL